MNNFFKFLLILFIGMMSMKGFSTTTDLGQDSIVTISSDDDVGTNVEQSIQIIITKTSTEVKTQQVVIRKEYKNISKYYFHNFFIVNNKIKKTYKPPTKYNNKKVLILYEKDKELA